MGGWGDTRGGIRDTVDDGGSTGGGVVGEKGRACGEVTEKSVTEKSVSLGLARGGKSGQQRRR